MKNLKTISKSLMTTMASALFMIAMAGAGAASFFATYEPKMPEGLEER